MKKIYFIIFLSLCMISFFQKVFAKIENKIVLKVENEIITTYEIRNKILRTLFFTNEEINQKNIDRLKRSSLESLIQLQLKEIELKKYNIKADQKIINNYLKSITSENIFDLEKKFEKNNLDFELFLNEIEVETRWQELIYNTFSKKIQFDESIINNDLANAIKNNSNIIEFNLSEIEILKDEKKSVNEIFTNLSNEIKQNGFETIAFKKSISSTKQKKGYLGWINSKSLSRQIFEIVNKMEVGDISIPIKVQNNILVLKLNDKRISKVEDINIQKLKERLINQKKNELFNLHSRSYLSKLRNTILIEYYEK